MNSWNKKNVRSIAEALGGPNQESKISHSEISPSVGVGFAVNRTDGIVILFVGDTQVWLSRSEAERVAWLLVDAAKQHRCSPTTHSGPVNEA